MKAALAVLGATALAGGAAGAQELGDRDRKALTEFASAADSGDCKTVLKVGEPFLERRRKALSGEILLLLYQAIAHCQFETDETEKARATALLGTSLPNSSPELWYTRLGAEAALGRRSDVASTLEAMAQGQGAALNDISQDWMWQFLRALKDAGEAGTRTRVLKLAMEFYRPTEAFGSNDSFRYLYAQDRIAAGDTAAAGPAVRGLEKPGNLAKALLDGRMRAFVSGADLKAAAERELARHRDWIGREPDRLRPLIAASENLRQLGRAREAVDVLKSAEPRLGRLTGGDDSDHVNWYWNEMALAYTALGRADDAIAAYRKGAEASESGQPNVSQLINMALAQNRFGRPKDSLATLATKDLSAGGASPYGTMLYRQARACAYHLSGRSAEAAPDIAFVRGHEKDAPAAATDLFLCLGDLDAAAATLVRRLDDAEQRADALLELSVFELAPPDLETDVIARNLSIIARRPEVRAAAERAGGVRRFNIAEV